VLQLIFKSGKGAVTVYDKAYGLERSFQLYDPPEIVSALDRSGLKLVPEEDGKLGGVMHFTDEKAVQTCIVLARYDGPLAEQGK
jgi:hypothetical protein